MLRGQDEARSGNYSEAILLFGKILESDPASCLALAWRGAVRRLQGDKGCCHDLELAKQLSEGPGDAREIAELSLCAYWLAQSTLAYLDRAYTFLDSYTETPWGHTDLAQILYGICLAMKGDHIQAEHVLTRKLDHPNPEAVLCVLAVMALDENKFKEAQEYAERALEQNKSNPVARLARSRAMNQEHAKKEDRSMPAGTPNGDLLKGVLFLPLLTLSPELFGQV
jgi:tetratricopeptide (TPR) repeat protein